MCFFLSYWLLFLCLFGECSLQLGKKLAINLLSLITFLENGRLSYDNPNYQLHLNAVRLEDALNSNTEPFNLNSALLGYSMDVLSPQLSNMVWFITFFYECRCFSLLVSHHTFHSNCFKPFSWNTFTSAQIYSYGLFLIIRISVWSWSSLAMDPTAAWAEAMLRANAATMRRLTRPPWVLTFMLGRLWTSTVPILTTTGSY